MGKQVYVFPFLAKLAMFIADHLPDIIRASVCIDFMDNLDDEFEHVMQIDGKSKTYFLAISANKIETMRREAYTEGLKCGIEEIEL